MGVNEIVVILVVALLLFGPTAVIAWFVWTLYRSSGEGHAARREDDSDPAVLVARRRFAAGEIDREEYEEILRTLGAGGEGGVRGG